MQVKSRARPAAHPMMAETSDADSTKCSRAHGAAAPAYAAEGEGGRSDRPGKRFDSTRSRQPGNLLLWY